MRTIRTVASAVAMTAAFGLGAGAALAEGKIVISNWDGYMPADLPEKFEAETGIEVEVALHATNEEIMGKVVAGKGRGYDVLFVSSPFAEALEQARAVLGDRSRPDPEHGQSLRRGRRTRL